MRLQYQGLYFGWIIVAIAFIIRVFGIGVRSSFGVFLLPLEQEFATGRASISLTASIALFVIAFSQPFIGRLVDALGAKRLLAMGAILIAVSQFLLSTARSPLEIYVYMGLIGGLGFGTVTSVPGAILITNWFFRRRGFALSLATSGIGIGLPVLAVPASLITLASGWRTGYLFLGGITLAILLPVMLLIREKPSQLDPREMGPSGSGADITSEERSTPLRTVFRTRPFWLLMSTYTVCGFTVTILDVHLVPIAVEAGVSQIVAAGALGTLGIFMGAGLIASGFAADKVGKKRMLMMSYSVRGVALLGLLSVRDPVSLYVVVAVFGIVELSTVPATTILCREFYGARSMGTVYGLVYFGHQVGSAVSSYVAGFIRDLTGSYAQIIIIAASLAFVAGALSLLLNEKTRIVHVSAPAVAKPLIKGPG